MNQSVVPSVALDEAPVSLLQQERRTVMYGGDPYEDDVEPLLPEQGHAGQDHCCTVRSFSSNSPR